MCVHRGGVTVSVFIISFSFHVKPRKFIIAFIVCITCRFSKWPTPFGCSISTSRPTVSVHIGRYVHTHTSGRPLRLPLVVNIIILTHPGAHLGSTLLDRCGRQHLQSHPSHIHQACWEATFLLTPVPDTTRLLEEIYVTAFKCETSCVCFTFCHILCVHNIVWLVLIISEFFKMLFTYHCSVMD